MRLQAWLTVNASLIYSINKYMQLLTQSDKVKEIITSYPWTKDILSSLIVQAIAYLMCTNNSLCFQISLQISSLNLIHQIWAELLNSNFKAFPRARFSQKVSLIHSNDMIRPKLIYRAEVLSDMQVLKITITSIILTTTRLISKINM